MKNEMLTLATERLAKMHKAQVHRDPWPLFDSFPVAGYSKELRREAAVQWAGRARAEYGSVHDFSSLTYALSESRAPLHILGALTRLQTDEVRHAEMCAEMAGACYPEGLEDEPHLFVMSVPAAPWSRSPTPEKGPAAIETWAACAIVSACCLGEALSKPMLEAIAIVATEPLCEAVARQILRDEHLHATFGFETLAWLLPRLTEEGREQVQERLREALGSLERSTACGISIEEVAESDIEIHASDNPNLGTLSSMQYAMIFYATLESEIFPRLESLGLDPVSAWAQR